MANLVTEITRPQRLVELDALRGIAATIVMLYHYVAAYGSFEGLQHEAGFPSAFGWGWTGVQIFFLISGFVIFMSLEKDISASDFLAFRAIRLYPTYWTGIVLTTVVVSVIGLPDWKLEWWQIAANFSMLHFFAEIPSVDGAYWSLAEELKFYVLMLIAKRCGLIDRPLLICSVWLAAASVFAVGMFYFDEGIADSCFRTCYLLVSGSYCFWFVCGIACYGIWKNWHNVSSYCIFALATGYFFLPIGIKTYPSPAMTGLLLLIFFIVVFVRPRVMRHKILVGLGSISYPLYVLHQNIGYCVIKTCYSTGLSGYIGVGLALFVALFLASLTHNWVERPANQLLRGLYAGYKTRTETMR